MTTPVTSIRNLGPATAELFTQCGIHSAEDIISLGADEAYAKLLRGGIKPHFIGYYALVMRLQGRPWQDCRGDEKKALRKKFDAIKRTNFDSELNAFEAHLDEIGLR